MSSGSTIGAERAAQPSGTERGACAELIEHHGRAVFACAQRILRDPAAAEEVVQETFFQAWRDAATYDPARGPMRAWLLVIARARSLDRLRGRRTRETRLAEFRRSACVDTGGTENSAGYLEMSRRWELEGLLRILPRSDRDFVSLAYARGLSHGAIADCTGMPLGTVKTRLRRILGLLRSALAGETRPFAWRWSPSTAPVGRVSVLGDLRIIVVDDEPDTLRLTTLVLERAGAHVVAVSSAAHALRSMRTNLPDVLVTDIGMPEQDGYQLLAGVRKLATGAARVPAVAFTAHRCGAEHARARRAGFAAVLNKPVRPSILVAKLAELTTGPAGLPPSSR